jgi:hypothetical protein
MLSSAKEEKMPKLTDSQSMVLSKAAAREDGVAVVPRGMNKAAAAKVGSSLVARKLMREIRSKPEMSIWREENGRNVSLVITRTGRDAIGVENDTAESDRSSAKKTGVAAASERGSIDGAPRPGSKQALIVEMLSKDHGASLDTMVEATGWLPHSTRAALTGLRKRGYAVERIRQETKGSLYRIVPDRKPAISEKPGEERVYRIVANDVSPKRKGRPGRHAA